MILGPRITVNGLELPLVRSTMQKLCRIKIENGLQHESEKIQFDNKYKNLTGYRLYTLR